MCKALDTECRREVSTFLLSPARREELTRVFRGRKEAPQADTRADLTCLDWVEWVDGRGQTVKLCVVNDPQGGAPAVLAQRDGRLIVHG